MTWSIRHQGSPKSVEGLTLQEVVDGLADGQWEPTDEVKGPQDAEWVMIENHPQLAEVAADLEPPPVKPYDDETRLDMTPLIDVTLVLLIFMILTTSYAALQKILEASASEQDDKRPVRVVKEKEIKEQHIVVKATMENGEPVVRVENEVVELHRLVAALHGYARATQKSTLLLEHDGDVPQDVVVQIIDKAKGAGMTRVLQVAP
jgi:biopolymer transport protein ExbD